MESGNNDKKMEDIYSKRLRAGKRRTYFFDVRSTKGNDYYLTITESRKRFDDNGYDRHKVFLYKEDFNKFLKALSEAVDYVKTDLMPDFDFDAFNHEYDEEGMPIPATGGYVAPVPTIVEEISVAEEAPVEEEKIEEVAKTTESDATTGSTTAAHEEVDKW